MTEKKVTAVQMIEHYKSQIQEVLPSHVKINKLIRVCQSQINQNPKLGMAEPAALMSAVMKCAQLGLEPGSALSKIHLIPFNNRKTGKTEVNVICGYQGLIELARRSGEISEIYAETVHKNDFFEISHGLNRDLKHNYKFGESRGELIGAYAVAKYKDGGIHFVAMDKIQLEAIRNRSKYPNPIWNSDYEEMAKKTTIRRLSKFLPLSEEKSESFHEANNLETKIEIDESQENNSILIEAGIPIPKETTIQQNVVIEDLKKKAIDLMNRISDKEIETLFKTTKQKVVDRMVDEKISTDILIMLKKIS